MVILVTHDIPEDKTPAPLRLCIVFPRQNSGRYVAKETGNGLSSVPKIYSWLFRRHYHSTLGLGMTRVLAVMWGGLLGLPLPFLTILGDDDGDEQ